MPLPTGYTLDAPNPPPPAAGSVPAGYKLDAPAQPVPETPSAWGFVKNAVSSGAKFAGNTAHAIAHPIDSINAMGNIAAGAANEYVPGYADFKKNVIGEKPEDIADETAQVDAFKGNLKDRYGSLDKFSHTFYHDPVGVLADLSTVAGGVSGVARGVGAVAEAADAANVVGGAGRVAKAANTVSDFTNPLAAAEKVGGAVVDAAKPLISSVAGKVADAISRPGFRPNLDPAEASAVQYGHDNGVQMPTSVQTGSKVAANAENILQNLPLASGVAKTARAAEQSTLAAAGAGEVAKLGGDAASGAAVPTHLDAGEALHQTALDNEQAHSAKADDSYSLFRSIENQPEFKTTVQTGTKRVESGIDEAGNPTYRNAPVMEDIQLPVDYRAMKAAVKPLLADTRRGMSITQRENSTGLSAMQDIVDSPDYVSASVADRDLGAMKGILRDSPQARSVGQVRFATEKLSAAVDEAANRAGPDAVAALKAGRASTVAKYQAQDFQRDLGFKNVGTGQVEPGSAVDLVNSLTSAGDRKISLLRQVQEQMPEHVPAIAQAVAQKLLDSVTAEAGLAKPQTALSTLNKMGPETKSLLFGDRAQAIQDFFTLAKKMGENPNPSGSGSLLATLHAGGMMLTNPVTGVATLLGSKMLAKVLFTPKGAQSLILAAKVPAASGAAGAALSTDILKAAGTFEAGPSTKQNGVVPATAPAGAANVPPSTGVSQNGEQLSNTSGGGAVAGSAQEGQAIRAALPATAGNPGAGNRTTIKVPGKPGPGYQAQYQLKELAGINGSHNGLTFSPNAAYKLTNDRNYANQVNQGKVVAGASAAEFDPALHLTDNPDATNGPVVTDSGGHVLGGNGRTMMLQRVYAGNPQGAAAYRSMLEAKAGQFGIDPAQVSQMKQPVLTREIADSEFSANSTKQDAVTDLNKVGTGALTPAERAISDSRRVSAGTLDDMASRLDAAGPKATVADVLEGKSGTDVLKKLIGDGVVSPQEQAAFGDADGLNKAGRDRISQLMIGRYFKDPAQLDSLQATVRAKVERIAAPLAQVEARPEWNLTPDVQAALDLVGRAKKAGIPSVDDFIAQDGLFGKTNYSPQAVTIARAMRTSKSAELVAAARQYAADASYASKGQSLLGDAPTPAESFDASFGALKSGAERDAAQVLTKAKAQKTIAVGGSSTATAVASAADAYEIGPHGPIFREHAGDWAAARDRLLSEKTGEVPGALLHPNVPPADLIWGEEGDTAGKGFGLAKIQKWHPEVLNELGDIYASLPVVERNANTIQLDDGRYHATIRRNWKGDSKTWLLTAFDKKAGK